MNDLISVRTRLAFRDAFSDFGVLRTIEDAFSAEGFKPVAELAPDVQVGGERRTLVQRYYESVDWSSVKDCERILRVFEDLLHEVADTDSDYARTALPKLQRQLERDDIKIDGGRLTLAHPDALIALQRGSGFDRDVIREHIRRIQNSVNDDPEQALGSSKELVESVAKLICEAYGDDPSGYSTVPKLTKAAAKHLDFDAESIPDNIKGAQTMKQLLAGLSQIAVGLAELRNLYGTGHGRHRPSGVKPRHGQLGVNAAVAWCSFALATLDERKAGGCGGAGATPQEIH